MKGLTAGVGIARQSSTLKRNPAKAGSKPIAAIRNAPSFEGHRPASEASSRTKKANRHIDTAPELLLRRELSRLGLAYRANVATLPGKPDVVFDNVRVVVFCDGDFWHGRNWRRLKKDLASRANASYWIAKIAYNRARDIQTRRWLRRQGWHIVRLWESEIRKDPARSAARIKIAINRLRRIS